MRQGISQLRLRSAEVTGPLRCGRHFELQRRHQPALFPTPLFIPEKEGRFFLTGPLKLNP